MSRPQEHRPPARQPSQPHTEVRHSPLAHRIVRPGACTCLNTPKCTAPYPAEAKQSTPLFNPRCAVNQGQANDWA